MRVFGRDRLDRFCKGHADAAPALQAWFHEASNASWKRPVDIKHRYASASFLTNDRVIFNIKGNRYRLITIVDYAAALVVIRWIGTHAQYSKIDAGKV
jgi:mRNA interferase HigB